MRSAASIRTRKALANPLSRPRYDFWRRPSRRRTEGHSIMQSENRFFDDLAKLVNGAAGTVAGLSRACGPHPRDKATQCTGGMAAGDRKRAVRGKSVSNRVKT